MVHRPAFATREQKRKLPTTIEAVQNASIVLLTVRPRAAGLTWLLPRVPTVAAPACLGQCSQPRRAWPHATDTSIHPMEPGWRGGSTPSLLPSPRVPCCCPRDPCSCIEAPLHWASGSLRVASGRLRFALKGRRKVSGSVVLAWTLRGRATPSHGRQLVFVKLCHPPRGA